MSTIIRVKLTQLIPNENNERVYGPVVLDDEFVQSIREHGVLQKPLITPAGDDMYRIVAGHRRYLAVESLGHEYIDCTMEVFASPELEHAAFIHSNKHRQKDTRVLLNEALELLNIEQKLCQASGEAGSSEENAEMLLETSAKEAAATQYDIATRLGVGRMFVDAVRVVFSDDYRIRFFDQIADAGVKLTKKVVADFTRQWDKMRKDVRAGKHTVYEAAKALRAERASVLGKKTPAPKTATKQTKAAKQKPTPKLTDNDPASINHVDNARQFLIDEFGDDWFDVEDWSIAKDDVPAMMQRYAAMVAA